MRRIGCFGLAVVFILALTVATPVQTAYGEEGSGGKPEPLCEGGITHPRELSNSQLYFTAYATYKRDADKLDEYLRKVLCANACFNVEIEASYTPDPNRRYKPTLRLMAEFENACTNDDFVAENNDPPIGCEVRHRGVEPLISLRIYRGIGVGRRSRCDSNFTNKIKEVITKESKQMSEQDPRNHSPN